MRYRAVAVALGLALVATACGGSSKKSDTASSSGSGSATTAAAGKPKYGGTLTFGMEADISTLDPVKAIAQPTDVDIALGIYDPLLGFDKDNNIVPFLAKSYKLSDDAKTFTMDLPTGIKFQDGTDFNADAVVAQINRLKDPNNKCPCASGLAQIADVKAPSPTQVVVTLSAPNVSFANTFTGSTGMIVSPAALAKYGADYQRNPVGTGAFMLKEFVQGDHVTVVKNPNYWRKDDNGNKLPYLDSIVFKPVPDTKQRLAALQAGNVDMFQSADPSTLNDAKASGFEIQKVSGSSSTIVILNTLKPPFDDERVRQAVSYATDREALNQAVWGGVRTPAYSAFATDSSYYVGKEGEEPHFDLAKAKQLVAAYGKPVKFLLECIPTPESNQILQLLQQQYKAAGMDVSLNTQEQGQYVSRMFQKQFPGAACFRSNQFVDPDQLYTGYHSDSSGNLASYSNPKVDQALETGRAKSDPAVRKDAYKTFQIEQAKAVPVIYLAYDIYANVHKKEVKGLPQAQPNSLGAINPATLYLDR